MSVRHSPQPLGQVLNELIEQLGFKTRLAEVRAVEAWANLAGAQINAVTDSVWMRDGRLFVKLTSSVWRQELHLRRSQWRDQLNEQLGSKVVTEIVFR